MKKDKHNAVDYVTDKYAINAWLKLYKQTRLDQLVEEQKQHNQQAVLAVATSAQSKEWAKEFRDLNSRLLLLSNEITVALRKQDIHKEAIYVPDALQYIPNIYPATLSPEEAMDKLLYQFVPTFCPWSMYTKLKETLDQNFAALHDLMKGKNFHDAHQFLVQLGIPVPPIRSKHEVTPQLPAVPLDLALIRGTLDTAQTPELSRIIEEQHTNETTKDL